MLNEEINPKVSDSRTTPGIGFKFETILSFCEFCVATWLKMQICNGMLMGMT